MDKNFNIDFIGIGTARSGTTWLFNALGQHPKICLSEPKEVMYFNYYHVHPNSNINKNHTKPPSWYRNHFRHCQKNKIKGEFSTSYLYDEKAPLLIKKYFPDVKLIACLRNPIDRAYSEYWMYRNKFKIGDRTFENTIREERRNIERGFYYKQLKRYL